MGPGVAEDLFLYPQREVLRVNGAVSWRVARALFASMTLGISVAASPRADVDIASACREGAKAIPQDQYASFPDENLELLTLRFSTGLHADESVYKRLEHDIGAIRAMNPQMTKVKYFAPNDGRTVTIFFDSDTLRNVKRHQYNDWNCVNSYFGASVVRVWELGFVEVRLGGLYKLEPVLELYRRLPGVTMADTFGKLGGSSTIYVSRETSRWVYLFDIAGGDCPAGCTQHELHYFEVSSEGTARELASTSDLRDPPPDWAKLYFRHYR